MVPNSLKKKLNPVPFIFLMFPISLSLLRQSPADFGFEEVCFGFDVEASTLETYETFYDCKAKTGAFGIAGLISADEAFCNFFRIEGELGCRNIFQADKYIFLRLSISHKTFGRHILQCYSEDFKDPAGLLTVQTKNHFFFRESGPESRPFFELISSVSLTCLNRLTISTFIKFRFTFCLFGLLIQRGLRSGLFRRIDLRSRISI